MELGGLEPPTSWVRFLRIGSPLVAVWRYELLCAARMVAGFVDIRSACPWVFDQDLTTASTSRLAAVAEKPCDGEPE
jgi:hypothetical protein